MDKLLNQAPCGFLSFTDEGIVTEVNDTLLGYLGYGREEVKGNQIERILTIASRIFYQTHFFPLIRLHGNADEIYLSLRAKGGEDVPTLVNAVRRAQDGAFINHCVFIPVRQRRKYEDEILQAKRVAEDAVRNNQELAKIRSDLEAHARMLDQQLSRRSRQNRELARISSILSHELREPIRKIAMLSDILHLEKRDVLTADDEVRLDKIKDATVRIDSLVAVLREFIMLGVSEMKLAAVDLNEVVEGAFRDASSHAGSGKIHVEKEKLPVVEGDRRQLYQLFYQLADNAVKFAKPDSALTVSVKSAIVQGNRFQSIKDRYKYVDFARIEVADNGLGFDDKYREYVFELLKKVDPSTPGLGVGLSICKRIVENHNGSISVRSAPGEGTRFTILLPISQTA